jgi:hypothetical protein
MTKQTVLERYVRSPVPVLPQSQFPYYNDELRKIEQALGGLYGAVRGTGPYVQMPYGSVISTVDQTMDATPVPKAITYSALMGSSGISYTNNSQIRVSEPGVYNVQFSLQLVNTNNDPSEVDVWFRKNGVDIDSSNSVFTVIQKKSTGTSGHLIAALNMFVQLDTTDYLELIWYSPVTGVTIETIPARTSPTIPATPSVIVTLDFLSG